MRQGAKQGAWLSVLPTKTYCCQTLCRMKIGLHIDDLDFGFPLFWCWKAHFRKSGQVTETLSSLIKIKAFHNGQTNAMHLPNSWWSCLPSNWNVYLSGSFQERAARSDALQGNLFYSAVHQKLLPVGKCSEESSSFSGKVTASLSLYFLLLFFPSSIRKVPPAPSPRERRPWKSYAPQL